MTIVGTLYIISVISFQQNIFAEYNFPRNITIKFLQKNRIRILLSLRIRFFIVYLTVSALSMICQIFSYFLFAEKVHASVQVNRHQNHCHAVKETDGSGHCAEYRHSHHVPALIHFVYHRRHNQSQQTDRQHIE